MPRWRRLLQHREQPLGLALVQRRIRLVEDQQARLFEQHAAEFDQLPLADADSRLDRRADIDMQAELVEQVAAAFLHRPHARPARGASARG